MVSCSMCSFTYTHGDNDYVQPNVRVSRLGHTRPHSGTGEYGKLLFNNKEMLNPVSTDAKRQKRQAQL